MPECAAAVTITPSSELPEALDAATGDYALQPDLTIGGRPIYYMDKSGTAMYIFFDDVDGMWVVGSNYTSNAGYFLSRDPLKPHCPYMASGWDHYDGVKWRAGGISMAITSPSPPPPPRYHATLATT